MHDRGWKREAVRGEPGGGGCYYIGRPWWLRANASRAAFGRASALSGISILISIQNFVANFLGAAIFWSSLICSSSGVLFFVFFMSSDSDSEDWIARLAAEAGSPNNHQEEKNNTQEQTQLIHVRHAAAQITLSVTAAPGSSTAVDSLPSI